MMRLRPFSAVGFFVLTGIVAGALFFAGPAIERPTASFLFSKIHFFAGVLTGGSPWVWGSGSETGSPAVADDGLKTFPMRAAVIFRTPSIPYDQIIIDRGERDGIRRDMTAVIVPGTTEASVGEEVLVGWVSDVFWDSSRVISPTSFSRETDVILEGSGTVVTAVGFGNRELRIRLPRDFPVRVGDLIFEAGSRRRLIGSVEKIVGEVSSAIKEAHVRQGINDRTVLSVYVIE